jgi:hypothetical protein
MTSIYTQGTGAPDLSPSRFGLKRKSHRLLSLVESEQAVAQTSNEKPLKLFQSEPAIILLDNCVAFTSELFEFVAVQNPHSAARIANDLSSLQNTGCQGHARSVCPQHGGKEIVRDGYIPRIHSIVGDQ